MHIEVEQMQSWIGSPACTAGGEKLGRIDEVYFVDSFSVAVGIRSGLAGRKHHVATLTGAAVSFDGVRVAAGEDDLVPTDGGQDRR